MYVLAGLSWEKLVTTRASGIPQITFTELPLHILLRKFCLLGCLGFWQNCTKGNCSIISWWLHDTLDPSLLEFASRFCVPREKSGLLCLLRSQCTKSGPNLISGRNHYQSIIKIALVGFDYFTFIKLLLYVFSFSLFHFIRSSMLTLPGEINRPLFFPDTEVPNRSRKGFYPNQTVSGVYWAGLRSAIHSRVPTTAEVIHEKPQLPSVLWTAGRRLSWGGVVHPMRGDGPPELPESCEPCPSAFLPPGRNVDIPDLRRSPESAHSYPGGRWLSWQPA